MRADVSVYLKQNAVIEPLFNQWYAWSHLIPPATAAMYMINSHFKIMHSFIANPEVHISALKDPAMQSGPFMQYGVGDVADIKALFEKTRSEQSLLLELGAAIQELDKVLSSDADGHSLEPLYQKVPEVLKGYVELVYDVNHNPSVRFIEGLLYKSKYYSTGPQSIALSLTTQDKRPFVFNTPRLEREGQLHLKVPFASEALDELYRMRSAPQPYGWIKEMLVVPDEADDLFSTFFTEEGASPAARFAAEGVRIRYFGHACILLESKNVSLICDPIISYKYDTDLVRYTFSDLPEMIDYALITHYHQDHLMLEMLLQLRHKVKNIIVPRSSGHGLIDPSLRRLLQVIGFRNVVEIDELEELEIPGGSITGLPFLGEHADLNIRTKTAYQVELEGKRILCMADSNNIEPKLYEHIHVAGADVDAVFIGMECDGAPLSWVYGPFLTRPLSRKMDQSRRLNGSDCEKAMDIVRRLKAKQVYVYAMGQEPWLSFVMGLQYTDTSRPIVESNRLVENCQSAGVTSERLLYQKEIMLAPQRAAIGS
jgi:L-ascorbate metabolism protein UlaG (beta-lactamase superfamily)